MDPVGVQKGKFPNNKGISKSKLDEENSWESNAPSDLSGGFNEKSGTRKAVGGKVEDEWQGKVKGNITHTFGVDGKNRGSK